MNIKAIALTALRAAALGLQLQGQTAAAKGLRLLASAAESGKNVDDHMAEVARKLDAGETIDWDDLTSRINAASDDLHQDRPTV